ncbi:hypothetical protein BN946_scf184601.g13 [Trametes cinnabarina]|uniref:Uncharacterized protein n=1 Tax=Pycnoporus cinnabarinus TaxID=5643 RepID=A0A060S6R5_PYCCI|nr:hypothetical protein BN946_scf184601.g13 [Trametes cinnabarina]
MLTLARVACFALLALSFITLAHASPASRRSATNAERLARGLTPARPKRLYNPSRTNVARSAPSGTPGSVQTGNIGVYAASTGTTPVRKRDEALGWLGAYGLSTDISTSWQYQYTEPASPDDVVEVNHPSTPYRLSGVAIRSGPQVTLGPGNAYYLELQNVRAHTPAGSATSTYVYDTYAIGYAQTTIFAIGSDGKLTVHWVNPDGSTPQLYTAVSGNNVYVTGDLNALASQLGTTPTPVDIWFDAADASQ